MKNTTWVRRLLILISALGTATVLSAQSEKQPVALEVKLKNLHSWRGVVGCNSPVTTFELSYQTADAALKVGSWSAFSLNGRWRGITYYVEYARSGFKLRLTDDPSSNDVFDTHTDHLIYADISYALPNERFPLKMLWSSMISGRDTYVDKSGKGKNRYSSYVELSMPLWKAEDQCVTFGVGGAFSLADSRSNFYGDHANATRVFVEYKSAIQVLNRCMPLSIESLWSPVHNNGVLQVAFQLL